MDGWLERWIDEWMDGLMQTRIDGQTMMYQWIDVLMYSLTYTLSGGNSGYSGGTGGKT